jgi:hypothetical protein
MTATRAGICGYSGLSLYDLSKKVGCRSNQIRIYVKIMMFQVALKTMAVQAYNNECYDRDEGPDE